jgi:hypothetical protein
MCLGSAQTHLVAAQKNIVTAQTHLVAAQKHLVAAQTHLVAAQKNLVAAQTYFGNWSLLCMFCAWNGHLKKKWPKVCLGSIYLFLIEKKIDRAKGRPEKRRSSQYFCNKDMFLWQGRPSQTHSLSMEQ